MEFFLDNGELCLDYNDRTISGISMALERFNARNDKDDLISGAWEVNGKMATSEVANGSKFILRAEKSEFGVLLYGGFETGTDDVFEKVVYLQIKGYLPHNPRSVITNDGMYNPGKGIFDMTAKAITTAFVGDQEIEGVDYVAYQANEDEYGVVGQVTFENYFSTVTLSENGFFKVCAHLNEHLRDINSVALKAGEIVETDGYLIAIGDRDQLPVYGKAIAQINGAERKFAPPMGWCSWYYCRKQPLH